MELQNEWEKKILLVDDEKDITDLLKKILWHEGFHRIRSAECAKQAIELCKEERPDLIILDIMLPDMSGFELCQHIRNISLCPILFLSAKTSDVDKVVGLSMGGDDYITKPFSPREIIARVKAQFRRQRYEGMVSTQEKAEERMSVGDLKIDFTSSQVCRGDHEITLTAKEYRILEFLAKNPNRIVSKERLCEVVWGEDNIGYDNTISVHIRHLREKLEENPSNPQLIVTVIGLGYKFMK